MRPAVPFLPEMLVVAAGLLAHGMLLITDHVIWDGWWFNVALGLDDSTLLVRQITEAGRPLDLLFLAPFRLFPDFASRMVAAKVAGVACWITASVLMMVFLRGCAGFSTGVATIVAILAATAPVPELLGELSMWMYTACVTLFWAGWALITSAHRTAGAARVSARIAALTAFFLSFNLNSQLVMFYGVAAMAATAPSFGSLRGTAIRSCAMARRHVDLLALPVVFWLWKSWATPATGFYQDYNKPSFDPATIAAGYTRIVLDFVVAGISGLFSSPSAVLVALTIGAALPWLVSRGLAGPCRSIFDEADEPAPLWMATWGFLLLWAASFPYVAVGKTLASTGFDSRNTILCPLPIALLVTGLSMLASRRLLPHRRLAWAIAAVMFVVLFVANCGRNYATLQAYGAKQLSVRGHLHAVQAETPACVVQLRDYYQIPQTIFYYPASIWTFIGGTADALPETFVFQTNPFLPDQQQVDEQGNVGLVIPQAHVTTSILEQMIEETTMPYALAGIPRTGRHVLLLVTPGRNGDAGVPLGLNYLWYKWFQPDGLHDFVKGMTDRRVVELPPVASD